MKINRIDSHYQTNQNKKTLTFKSGFKPHPVFETLIKREINSLAPDQTLANAFLSLLGDGVTFGYKKTASALTKSRFGVIEIQLPGEVKRIFELSTEGDTFILPYEHRPPFRNGIHYTSIPLPKPNLETLKLSENGKGTAENTNCLDYLVDFIKILSTSDRHAGTTQIRPEHLIDPPHEFEADILNSLRLCETQGYIVPPSTLEFPRHDYYAKFGSENARQMQDIGKVFNRTIDQILVTTEGWIEDRQTQSPLIRELDEAVSPSNPLRAKYSTEIHNITRKYYRIIYRKIFGKDCDI